MRLCSSLFQGRKQVALALLLSLFSGLLMAQPRTVKSAVYSATGTDFSYQHLSLDYRMAGGSRYGQRKVKNRDGFALSAGLPILQEKPWGGLVLIGSLASYSDKRYGLSLDENSFAGGVLYHLNVGKLSTVSALNNMDGFVSVEMEHADYDYVVCDALSCRKRSDDDRGPKLSTGARYHLSPELEAYASLHLRTVGDNELYLASGVRYQLNALFQLHAGFDLSDDEVRQVGMSYLF